MENKELLLLCCKITGSFEAAGEPDFSDLSGNSDGQGISVGMLQWNAGQGTLQNLLINVGMKIGWDKIQSFFKSDIHHLAVLKPSDAVQFCIQHYLRDDQKTLAPEAIEAWKNFLSQPEVIQVQTDLATNTILTRALRLSEKFCVDFKGSPQVISFFFDLVTQSGGMRNAKGEVAPVPKDSPLISEAVSKALSVSVLKSKKCVALWEPILQAADILPKLLFYYAFKRSLLTRPEYQWDSFSRRAAIACKHGIVHGKEYDFTTLLT